MDLIATVLLTIAVIHTFLVSRFQRLSARYREGSAAANFLHLLGEVEIVFGFWAGVLILCLYGAIGPERAVAYVEGLDFTEPAFVFTIMTIASSRPVLHAANALLGAASRLVPVNPAVAFYFVTLTLGPLLGSFITEPAAMTVTAIVLRDKYFNQGISRRLMYMTLGLLFVNVSIGGVITPYAAPPVLMVAGKWGWGMAHMAANFGWRAALACAVSAVLVIAANLAELKRLSARIPDRTITETRIPLPVVAAHVLFLALVVVHSHHMVIFLGLLLFFLGVTAVAREYQSKLSLREPLLVGFFLGGVVVLGGFQRWWLEPLLAGLDSAALYFGATALTAVTDNAALTYLGSQVPGLTDAAKYALVAGAVTGGGLTVIANAPNPAGFGILNSSFGENGISPVGLLAAAIPPTMVAVACFWLIP